MAAANLANISGPYRSLLLFRWGFRLSKQIHKPYDFPRERSPFASTVTRVVAAKVHDVHPVPAITGVVLAADQAKSDLQPRPPTEPQLRTALL